VNHRVVLVDDVPEIRQILRLILEHAGPFEVVGEGRNGHDAMSLAADLQPDLIVMDVEMRGGPSGWEVLPQIRESSPRTAVVILSGSAADPMRTDREALADGVLEKGLPPQELNDALLEILGRPSRPAPVVKVASTAPRSAPAATADGVLAALVDLTSEAVVQLTPDLVVRSWNRGAERLYGVGAGAAIGKPFATWCTEAVLADVERAADGDHVESPALSAVPLADGVLVVARDRSASHASDQAMAWAVAELDTKRREVERSKRELEGFASVASHDIAQPLQVAYGYLEMVRSEFAEGMDETAATWIDAAVGSLERMRRLVQDILAYARGGNRDIVPELVSVEEAALSALSAVDGVVQERGATVRLHEPLPSVAGNDEFLAQVLERLLDNAVRFVPDGRTPVVEIAAEEGADEWVITVADNGDGIPPDLAERVFDVFYRGGKGPSRGTGLGLSLSRKLIDRMGGRIWVEPRPAGAEGASIRFALPKDVT
jgi:signal transduction histidine kinase